MEDGETVTQIPSGYNDAKSASPALFIADSVLVASGVAAVLVGIFTTTRLIATTPELTPLPLNHPSSWHVFIVILTVQSFVHLPFGLFATVVDALVCQRLTTQRFTWAIGCFAALMAALIVSASWWNWVVLGLPLRVDISRVGVGSAVGCAGILCRRAYVQYMKRSRSYGANLPP